jgi:hypothetical protein
MHSEQLEMNFYNVNFGTQKDEVKVTSVNGNGCLGYIPRSRANATNAT